MARKGVKLWSDEEMAAIDSFFSKHIEDLRVPGKEQCEAAKQKFPEALKGRDWKGIKFCVYNKIQTKKKQGTLYNLYRYIVCENFKKVLYYIVNELKENRNCDSAWFRLLVMQTSLLLYGVILPSPFFIKCCRSSQSWPSNKIKLFSRDFLPNIFFSYIDKILYNVQKTSDTERREEEGDEKSSDKCPWTQPEVCAVEKHMQSFINDLVTPGKLDCLQVKRRCGAVLRERSWKQIKFYVYNRVLKRRRMQSNEWRSDRQLITVS